MASLISMEGKYINVIFLEAFSFPESSRIENATRRWERECFRGLFLHITITDGYTAYHAAKLETDLLTNYAPKIRPYGTTPVSLDFGLMHITELNIVTQTLHCVGFIAAFWHDYRLQWNAEDYDNMTDTFMRLSDIWSPPLLLNNAAEEISIMNDDSSLSSLSVFVFNFGLVGWLAPANFLAQCTINIKYYPFDSQSCHVVVSSWMFLDYHMPITSMSDHINFEIYEENGEWAVTGSSVHNISRVLSGHRMPAVKFTINLSRKYSYYLMNMLLPVIILAMMAPFVFLLPAASGEKIGYALTILLSLSVVMTLVSDNIPPTSTNTCILSVYLLMIFIICSLETLLTVWICKIHEVKVTDQQIGPKMNKFAGFLATIMRYRRPEESNKPHVSKNTVATVHDLDMIKDSKVGSDVKKAWKKDNDDTEPVKDYTPSELIDLFDRFNFYMFITITVVATAIIMVTLQIGGQIKQ